MMVGLHGEAGCCGQRLAGDGWVSHAIVVAFGDAPLVEGCGELTPNQRASLWMMCNSCLYPQAEYSLGVTDIFCILSL